MRSFPEWVVLEVIVRKGEAVMVEIVPKQAAAQAAGVLATDVTLVREIRAVSEIVHKQANAMVKIVQQQELHRLAADARTEIAEEAEDSLEVSSRQSEVSSAGSLEVKNKIKAVL